MRIENQICSLEHAKKLKSLLGQPVGALAYFENARGEWIKDDKGKNILQYSHSIGFTAEVVSAAEFAEMQENVFPAFTVGELGSLVAFMHEKYPDNLPDGMYSPEVEYADMWKPYFLSVFLIKALEAGHVSAEEVNARLTSA